MDGCEFLGHLRRRRTRFTPGTLKYIMKPFGRKNVAAEFQEPRLTDPMSVSIVPPACERPSVTLPEYEYLRNYLKEHSGLDLAADKQYLIESRLLPLARQAACPASANWCRK
jgi:hypothetical protein